MVNTKKVTAAEWLEVGKQVLIEKGIAGVSVENLARAIGVSRGGFYYNFDTIDAFLSELLKLWRVSNLFLPKAEKPEDFLSAYRLLDKVLDRLIEEVEFSPNFDMAIRNWAQGDPKVRRVLNRVDNGRVRDLKAIFMSLGMAENEAELRARTFYYHQIGYYSLGHHKTETRAKRLANQNAYLEILVGDRFAEHS